MLKLVLRGPKAAHASIWAPPYFQVDMRDYGVAAHILHDLSVASIAIITANPSKVSCLRAHGIEIVQQLVAGAEILAPEPALAAAAAERAPKGHGAPRTSRNGCEPHFV